jgi:hypothetical protein
VLNPATRGSPTNPSFPISPTCFCHRSTRSEWKPALCLRSSSIRLALPIRLTGPRSAFPRIPIQTAPFRVLSQIKSAEFRCESSFRQARAKPTSKWVLWRNERSFLPCDVLVQRKELVRFRTVHRWPARRGLLEETLQALLHFLLTINTSLTRYLLIYFPKCFWSGKLSYSVSGIVVCQSLPDN